VRFLRGRGIDPETREAIQPRLWGLILALAVLVAYIVAFVVENDKRVTVHFVFVTAHTSVIWLVLLSVAIGLVVGVLLSQLERRRRRHQRG
jgi:uncharacterized integral membrane protein